MNDPCRKAVLFDLDWTLVNVVAKYGPAMQIAFQQVYGREAKSRRSDLAGNPMSQIMRLILLDNGFTREKIDPHLTEAMEVQSRAVIESLEPDLTSAVLPGVPGLLTCLQATGHALALITGTQGPIVSVVLERAGLKSFFPVAVCGDEGELRPDLLRLALQRIPAVYGFEPRPEQVVVVGDTPHDIHAGRLVGARVVAVATGRDTMDLLATHHPDALLPSLADTQQALNAILNGHIARSQCEPAAANIG